MNSAVIKNSIISNNAVGILLVAVAYAVSSLLGDLLASSPSDASPFWPAAGVGLAGLLLGGIGLWPGILLGDLAFNLINHPVANGNLLDIAWVLLDTTGPTLQAVLGAAYISRYLQLSLEGDIASVAKSYLIGVLLCCMVSPSFGVPVLFIRDLMPASAFGSTWFSWWIGDSLGVMLFTPFIVLLAYNFKQAKLGKYSVIIPPLALVMVVMIFAILWFQNSEKESYKDSLRVESDQTLEIFVERLKGATDALQSVKRYIAVEEQIDEEKLNSYIEQIDEVGIRSFSWFPRVQTQPDENRALAPGFDSTRGLAITTFGDTQEFVPVAEKEEYFPVVYTSVDFLGGRFYGFDPTSVPAQNAVLEQARDNDEMVLSENFSLGIVDLPVFVFYAPVFESLNNNATVEERRANIKGYIGAVIEPNILIPSADHVSSAKAIAYELFDTVGGAPLLLNPSVDDLAKNGVQIESKLINIFGRQLEWAAYVDTGFWLPGQSTESRLFLIAVLLIILLFSFMLSNFISRSRLVQNKVVERTKELSLERAKLGQALDIASVLAWSIKLTEKTVVMDDRSYSFLRTNVEAEGGYELDLGLWFERFVHEDDRAVLLNSILGEEWSANSIESREIEGRLCRRDGKVRNVAFRFSAQFDSEGNAVELFGTAQDVTQRKEMLQALQASEEYSRKIIESSQDCIKVHDLDGVILSITDRGMELMAIPDRSAVLDIDWITFWDSDRDRKAYSTAIEEARNGRTGHFQGSAPTMAGEPRSWDIHISPIFDSEGYVVRLLSVSRDITGEIESKLSLEALNIRLEAEVQSRTLELAESEKRYRNMFVSNPIPMWVFEEDTLKFTAVNQAALDTYGYSEEEFLGMSLLDLRPAEDRERTLELLKTRPKNKTAKFEGTVHIRKDGSRLHVDTTSHSLMEGDKQYRIVMSNDITERLKANAELKKQQDLTRLILENLSEGVVACDSEGQLILFNKAAREWHGADPRKMAPERWGEFYDLCEADGKTLLETEDIPLVRAFNGEKVSNTEMSIRKTGSQPRFVIASGEALISGNGEKVGAVVVMHDITEQKIVARDLAQQQELNRLVLENLSEGVAVCNQQGEIVFANKTIRDWLRSGGGESSTQEESFFELFEGDSEVPVAEQVRPLARAVNGEVVRNLEFRMRNKFNVQFRLNVSGGPIVDASGEKLGAAVVLHDITERIDSQHRLESSARQLLEANAQIENERAKLAERVQQRTKELTVTNEQLQVAKTEAEAASRAKSSFLAVMSHEIRTPMNGIVGMVDVLAHSNLEAQHASYIKTIKDSAFSVLGIIDDILDFSKIEASRMELERRQFSLIQVAEGVVDTLSVLSQDNGVSVRVYVEPTLPRFVWGDPKRLRQVLMNLLGNAIKFSSSRPDIPGEVRISIESDQSNSGQTLIRIFDNGIGISSEQMRNLFTSFSQAETSTTRMFGGTGLGLAISKRLVKLMGGDIEVKSDYGFGSEFCVSLSLEEVSSQEQVYLYESLDLSDLQCVLVNFTDEDFDDVKAYLNSASANVVRVATLDEAATISEASGKESVVVVHNTGLKRPLDSELESLVAQYKKLQIFLINSGRRCNPRILRTGLVSMDDVFIRKYELLHGVAVTAGKVSALGVDDTQETLQLGEIKATTVAEARAQGRLILVAEDDKTNQKVILRQLSMLGYAAEVASNGAEAWQMWQKGDYACVLTDLHMPQMDGYSLTKNIRAHQLRNKRVPILMLSANALSGEAEKALSFGVDAFLTKPLQLRVLNDALTKWFPKDAAKDSLPLSMTSSNEVVDSVNFDLSVLVAAIGEDSAMINEVLAEYLVSALKVRDELFLAAMEGQVDKIGSLAHRLKGSSRIVGALRLGDLCAELEKAGRNEDFIVVENFMPIMDAELTEVANNIRSAMAA